MVDFPPRDFEKITVTSAVKQLSTSKVANAVGIFMTVEDANIRYRIDASAASVSATVGHLIYAGNNLMLIDGKGNTLSNLRFTRAGLSDATVQVTYYG
jgi:hypothetical protein